MNDASYPLIGIDWGTTRLRAYLFRHDGNVQESRTLPYGVRHLPPDGFEGAFAEAVAGWPTVPVIASGMIGSRNGWHEAPYVDVPMDPMMLSTALMRITTSSGRWVHLVPGVRQPNNSPDVMRGAETQLIGALDKGLSPMGQAVFVLPGTYSKWVTVRHGRIVDLMTWMTGELYNVLLRHTILATAIPEHSDHGTFVRGLLAARDAGPGGVHALLFSTRALMLDGKLAANQVPDYVSGLLIGEEFRAALATARVGAGMTVYLVGEDALCDRYHSAAREFRLRVTPCSKDCGARGLWLLATMAGLTRQS